MLKILHAALISSALMASPLAAQDDPFEFHELEGMGPKAIGERALAGLDHAEIVAVEFNDHPMDPPGMNRVYLFEMPRRTGNGCVRGRWYTNFRTAVPPLTRRGLDMESRSRSQEVALASDVPCQFADFTSISREMEADVALGLLQELADLSGTERPIACEDRTDTDLCRNDDFVRRQLRYLSAWSLVLDDDGNPEFRLGERGGVVTSVTMPANRAQPVQVARYVPPPF